MLHLAAFDVVSSITQELGTSLTCKRENKKHLITVFNGKFHYYNTKLMITLLSEECHLDSPQ